MFANGLGDLGSIPRRVIPKTLKMVLDTSLLNTQHYKILIKSKMEQSRERSRRHPLPLSVVAIEKGAFGFTLDYGRQTTILDSIPRNSFFDQTYDLIHSLQKTKKKKKKKNEFMSFFFSSPQ